MDGFKTKLLVDGMYHSVARSYHLNLKDGKFQNCEGRRQPRMRVNSIKGLYDISNSLNINQWVKVENHYWGGEEHILIHRNNDESVNLFYLFDRF